MPDKPRKPWASALLTLFVVGLGHLYTGEARRGLKLYFFGQSFLVMVVLSLVYFYPTLTGLVLSVLFVVFFLIFCMIDAARLSKGKVVAYRLKKYNRWYVYLACLVLASFVVQPLVGAAIKTFLIQAYKIPAGSLKPTILSGDYILAKKFYFIKAGVGRGDIIVFPFPEDTSKDFIKRVVALSGETVEIVKKRIFINGDPVHEPYVIHVDPQIIPKNFSPRDTYGPVTVPDDALFVLGDNRDNSYDSRFWGFVQTTTVRGKAQSIYWSWDAENNKIRWDRIGKIIPK